MKRGTGLIKSVLGVVFLIVVVAGSTYAIYSWATNPDDGYISGTSECFVLDYTKGVDILNGSLDFGSTYTDGLSATVKAKISDSCNIENGVGTLYLDTKDVTSDYLVSSQILRYQVLEDGVEVKSGVISSKGKNPIYENIDITKTEKSFTVYLWINIADATNDNVSELSSSVYSGGIQMSAESR